MSGSAAEDYVLRGRWPYDCVKGGQRNAPEVGSRRTGDRAGGHAFGTKNRGGWLIYGCFEHLTFLEIRGFSLYRPPPMLSANRETPSLKKKKV